MSRTFSFNASVVCNNTRINLDVLCIAYGNEEIVGQLQFFGHMEVAIKKRQILPDCIVIIASKELANNLYYYWNTDITQRETIINRSAKNGCAFVKSYDFYAWGEGQLEKLEHYNSSTSFYDIPTEKLIQCGLHNLLKENDVVQIAPSGHLFKHPSGTKSKLFIQAREMARNEPELCFVANAIYLYKGNVLKNAEIVFIDTMGIYPYVREALKAAGKHARIESFHSYGDLKKVSPPADPYLCVISASTTGGMARRLVKKQHFDSSKIITLIDLTTTDRCGKVMTPLDTLGENYTDLSANGTETEIELVGEHFTSKAKPPRAVTLGISHQPKSLGKFLKHFAINGMGKLNSSPNLRVGAAKRRLLSLDASFLTENQEFKKWLNDEIDWCVTLAVDYVVYTSDTTSEKIAELAAKRIKELNHASILPKIVSSDELCHETISNANGILIVSAVIGDGSLLREISRDLREYVQTERPRHFLVAVGLPQNEESWSRLKQFLERNPTKRKYGFSNWLVLPIGYDGKDNAWELLNNLAEKAQIIKNDTNFEGIDKNIVSASLDRLDQVVSGNSQGFLPKTNGDKLALTEGFIFFEGEFESEIKEQKIPVGTVYLAIASALQCARELKDKNNQLKSTGYESVVLAPECFLRFNDNILQACLLRACHPSELDYSSSPHLSKLMKEFLTKIFNRHNYTYGDSALEFAGAMATGRLRLKNDDFDTVTKKAIEELKSEPSPLLGFLWLARKNGGYNH